MWGIESNEVRPKESLGIPKPSGCVSLNYFEVAGARLPAGIKRVRVENEAFDQK